MNISSVVVYDTNLILLLMCCTSRPNFDPWFAWSAAAAAGLIYSKQSKPSALKSEAAIIPSPLEDGEIKVGDKTYQVR